MIIFDCKNKKIKTELNDIIRMYTPFLKDDLNLSLSFFGGICLIKIDEKSYRHSYGGRVSYSFIKPKAKAIKRHKATKSQYNKNPQLLRFNKKLFSRKLTKRLKKNLYLAMSDYFNKKLPWGSLTGIRPTKIGYSYLAAGGSIDKIADMLQKKYYISAQKAELIKEIIKNQQKYLVRDKNKVNLYIHIPFCPTRCDYCSFVSLTSARNEKLIEEYLTLLCAEIKATKQLLFSLNKEILSVYIGGGTPTVLTENQLERLLAAVDIGEMYLKKTGIRPNFKDNADADENEIEFTLEAGRPDTITAEKLKIMRDYGVNRISVNPQTFSEKTLQNIGRNHTVASVYYALGASKSYGFTINMDLIAGLDGESLDDFKHSLDTAARLGAHNLTIHTLSLKNGSKFYEKGLQHTTEGVVAEMLDYAYIRLAQNGYYPYYLYRQKNMADNLENVGFCLENWQSVNNITVMEESVSVWGCGAGAISKTVKDSLINRHASLRDVKLYIENFDERLRAKLKFLAK